MDLEGFTFDERIGIYFSVQSACLSAASVTILLIYALTRFLKRVRLRRRLAAAQNPSGPLKLPAQTDVTDSSLFLNLMLADLIQAAGNMPSIRWMRDGRITTGSLCTAQAVIKQIGINGVALTSLAIAVHTFSILILRWRAPRHISKFLVAGVWAMTALVVGVPYAVHRKDEYYGDTEYWCWILKRYKTEQIVSEYLWVWTAALLMAILYGIMFLVMRGFVDLEGGRIRFGKGREKRRRADEDREASGDSVSVSAGRKKRMEEDELSEEERETRAIANLLLFYPAVYIVCVLPNTIARWLTFSGHTIPFQATLFASAVFALSGMFNVVLFFWTRPDLVKGGHDSESMLDGVEGHTHKVDVHGAHGAISEKYSGYSPSTGSGSANYGSRGFAESAALPQQGQQSPLSTSATRTLPPPWSGTGYSLGSSTNGGHSQNGRTYDAATNRDGGLAEDSDEEDYGRLPG